MFRQNEGSRCKHLDDSLMSCHGITFNPEYTSVIVINNAVILGDSEDTFDVITENNINSRSKYVVTLICMPLTIINFTGDLNIPRP